CRNQDCTGNVSSARSLKFFPAARRGPPRRDRGPHLRLTWSGLDPVRSIRAPAHQADAALSRRKHGFDSPSARHKYHELDEVTWGASNELSMARSRPRLATLGGCTIHTTVLSGLECGQPHQPPLGGDG